MLQATPTPHHQPLSTAPPPPPTGLLVDGRPNSAQPLNMVAITDRLPIMEAVIKESQRLRPSL